MRRTRQVGLVRVAAACLLLLAIPATQATGASTWVRTGATHEQYAYHSAALLHDGTVLVTGGPYSNKASAAERYDPVTGHWRNVGPIGNAVNAYPYRSPTTLADGRVLVVGEENCVLYDPLTDRWTMLDALNVPRGGYRVVPLPDDTALVIGGVRMNGASTPIERFDPTTMRWSIVDTVAWLQHVVPSATLLRDGRILLVGGTISGHPTDIVQIYDPVTATMTTAASTPQYLDNHTATLLPDGDVLVAGKRFDAAVAKTYNPTTNTWAATAPMLAVRSGHTATLLPNGEVLVVGGWGPYTADHRQNYLASAERYNPTTNTWSADATMIGRRAAHTATLLNDGTIMVTGGQVPMSDRPYSAGTRDISTAERYVPQGVPMPVLAPYYGPLGLPVWLWWGGLVALGSFVAVSCVARIRKYRLRRRG